MSKIVLTILELAVSEAYVFGFQKLFTSYQCSLSTQARFFDSSERSLAAAEHPCVGTNHPNFKRICDSPHLTGISAEEITS